MPQYSGVWSLQQQMQALTSGQWATDPNFKNTTLLLQGDAGANGAQNNTFYDTSPNQFAITRNGNTTQGTFSPFSATGWSNYFNGSSYLTAPANTAFAFGTGNLTVEMWLYITAYPGSSAADYFCPATNRPYNAGDSTTWMVIVYGDGTFKFSDSLGTQQVSTTATIPLNRWTHIAVVRSSTSTNGLTIYFNGVAVAQGTNSINFSSTANTLVMGWANDSTAGRYLNGYMSNLRIVKGSAVYTANFNPPTEPLTAITNTQLLTCQSNRFVDNSSNAFAVTVNGTPSVQPFSPFAPQYQWTSSVIGGSAYGDGTGDYLSIASNAAFELPGNFTAEFWVYLNSYSNNRQFGTIATTDGLGIWCGSTGYFQIDRAAVGILVTSSIKTNLNEWCHVAVTRSGSTLTIYINGVSGGSTTYSTTFAQGVMYLGYSGYSLNGYMSSTRLVKGQSLTSGTFTPPTSPVTTSSVGWTGANVASSITGTISLLTNFTNAGIYDGTMKNNLETVGNAQISTSVVKYGSGSMYFNGTTGYLKPYYPAPTNGTNFSFGTGDFTVEFWMYPTSAPSNGMIMDGRGSGASGDMWLINWVSGVISWYVGGALISSSTVSTNTWTHVAICRSGTSTKMFLNGTQTGSTYTDTKNYTVGNGWPTIGASYNAIEFFTGYLDDLRITKGIARYTQNFIPPSVALPRQ